MRILGFGYKKRVGKDTCVKFALSHLRQFRPDLRCHVLDFGAQVKKVSYQMYSWGGLEEQIYYENHPLEIEDVIPAIGKTPRQIWDTVGLMGREINPRVWCELAIKAAPEADILLSNSVRSPAEIGLVRSFDGHMVKVMRSSAPKGGPVDELLDDYHGWDGTIINDGDLRTLNLTVKSYVNDLLNAWVL